MLEPFYELFGNDNLQTLFKFFYYTAFIWFPVTVLYIIWELWVRYVQALHFAKQKYVVLEIKLPKEIHKSPQAAEFFINSLYQTTGETTWFNRFWEGKVRSWFSLEIAAIDGAVHFFVWTKVGHKSLLEAALYSQYPGIEIYEVPDYTLNISYNSEVNSYWASEFELSKEDAFPIKTYVDYGLDKNPEEEYKIDPITPLIEFLGSLPRDSQAWVQILVRAHKAEEKDDSKTFFGSKFWTTFKPKDIWDFIDKKDIRWKEMAKEKVKEIVDGAKGEKGPDGKFLPGTGRQLTETEKETISAINRSVSKNGFDVGIRTVYFAPKDTFDIGNQGGIIGGITHFNSHLNGFKPVRGSEERYGFWLLSWKKRSDKKRDKERAELLDKYKRRGYFHKPFKSPHFILNSEELATIYHFPGGVSATPAFGRIESRKAEPPSNIPV